MLSLVVQVLSFYLIVLSVATAHPSVRLVPITPLIIWHISLYFTLYIMSAVYVFQLNNPPKPHGLGHLGILFFCLLFLPFFPFGNLPTGPLKALRRILCSSALADLCHATVIPPQRPDKVQDILYQKNHEHDAHKNWATVSVVVLSAVALLFKTSSA